MDKWEMRLNLNVTQKRFAFQSDNQHLHTKAAAAALTDQQLFKQKLCNVKEWMREDLNPLVSVKCSTFILPSITSHLSTHSLHCCCYLRHLMCRFPLPNSVERSNINHFLVLMLSCRRAMTLRSSLSRKSNKRNFSGGASCVMFSISF